jgi:hypothetical protein
MGASTSRDLVSGASLGSFASERPRQLKRHSSFPQLAAAGSGQLDLVQQLLDAGMDVNSVDEARFLVPPRALPDGVVCLWQPGVGVLLCAGQASVFGRCM